MRRVNSINTTTHEFKLSNFSSSSSEVLNLVIDDIGRSIENEVSHALAFENYFSAEFEFKNFML